MRLTRIIVLTILVAMAYISVCQANSAVGLFNENWPIQPYAIINQTDGAINATIFIENSKTRGSVNVGLAGNDVEIILLRDMVCEAFGYIGTPQDKNFYDILSGSLENDPTIKIYSDDPVTIERLWSWPVE